MHTGLEEIMNLAWKLAAMLAGWGGPALLASYEAERRPIAVRNVEYATRSYNAIASIPGVRDTDDPAAWSRTRRAGFRSPSISSRNTATRARRSVRRTTRPVPEPETAQFVPSTRPGSRAPHAWLADDRSTIDLFGDGFVLLRLGANPPDAAPLVDAAKARGVPFSNDARFPIRRSPRSMRSGSSWCGRTATWPGAAMSRPPTPRR